MSTSHEANKIAAADLVHGQYDIETKTLTLKNGAGVTAELSVGNSGGVYIGPDGVLTVPMLNAWEFQTMAFRDSMGTVKNLVPSITGSLVYGTSALVDLNGLMYYHDAAKQDAIVGLTQGTVPPITVWGPSHFGTVAFSHNWTNATTHSVLVSRGPPSGYDLYESITNKQGIQYKIEVDVKLVGSATTWCMGFQNPNVGQTWTTAHGLNTSTYTTVSMTTTIASAGAYWELGYMSWYTGAQPNAGDTFHLQNLTVTEIASATAVSLAQDLIVTGGITCSSAIQCVSLVQTSDEAIKENVALASLEELQGIFDRVNVMTYTRNDGVHGPRVGFVAQHLQAAIGEDSKLQNIVMPVYTDGPPLLGLDYARLTCLLWAVCKIQKAELAALTARVVTLESKKRKT